MRSCWFNIKPVGQSHYKDRSNLTGLVLPHWVDLHFCTPLSSYKSYLNSQPKQTSVLENIEHLFITESVSNLVQERYNA